MSQRKLETALEEIGEGIVARQQLSENVKHTNASVPYRKTIRERHRGESARKAAEEALNQ